MGSFIQTDSIFIHLTDSLDNTDTEKCEHFSLRGYVSNMRKVDWRKCWPFPLKESKEQPSFPKLEEPKFKWWACQNCRQSIKVQCTDNKDERTYFDCCNTRRGSDNNCHDVAITSGIQQDPTPNSSFVRRDIDLNIPIDLSSGNDVLPIDFESGLENNHNLQVSNIPSPEVGSDLAQEVHTKKRGRENDEVSDVEPLATNIINEHPTKHLPPESIACSDVVLMENTDNNVKEDIMDHRPSKSTSLSRKKHQKMRLISDLLRENREPELEQTTKVHESASHPPTDASVDSQTLAILPDIVDVQEDTPTKKRGRASDGVSVVETLARNFNNEHSMRHLPQESIVCSDVPTGNNNNIVKEDILDHYPSKSTSLPRKKHQKMRSISDLLSQNQDPVTEQTTRVHESTSHPPTNASTESQRLLVLPNKEDVQEDITLAKLCHGRKKKLLSNEKSKRPVVDMFYQRTEIEIQNREGDAKTIVTIPENRPEEFCNKNSIHQTKKQLSFSLPLQESTSKHQPIKKDSETNISRVSRHIANGTRGKGKGVHIEEINGAKNKAKTAEVMREVGGMRTMEDSEQGTLNDIPMDVVEFMTKIQYERSLPDMENKTGLLEESTHKESGNIIRENFELSENGKSINLERRDKQVKKRDINLNKPKSNGLGTLRSTNAESLMDTNKQSITSFNAVVGAQMLQKAFYPRHCNNKLKIGSLKSGQNVTKSGKGESFKSSTMQNGASKQFTWHNHHKIKLKELDNRMNVRGSQETPGPSNNISENVCTINRNPADVTVIEERNAYMINGEDMIFEDNVPEERPGLPAPQGSNSKRNLKGNMKEQQNH